LFLLGHSVWGYLFCKGSERKLKGDIPLSLALLAGIIPDFDFFLQPLGLAHHTYTHSIIILGPLAILLTIIFRRRGLIFSLGVLSHLFTDGLVGTVPILFPLSLMQVGLGLGAPSAIDTILEVGILPLALLYAVMNGDARAILRGDPRNRWIIIPLIAILSISLLFAQDNNIHLPSYAFARQALTGITIGHFLLGGVMALAIIQGFRSWFKNKQISIKVEG